MGRGFTLIELIVTAVILGILSASLFILTPALFTGIRKWQTESELDNLKKAIKMYAYDLGSFPGDLTDLVQDTGAPSWEGPYTNEDMLEVALDGWGGYYEYQTAGVQALVLSKGKNGVLDSNLAGWSSPTWTAGGDDIFMKVEVVDEEFLRKRETVRKLKRLAEILEGYFARKCMRGESPVAGIGHFPQWLTLAVDDEYLYDAWGNQFWCGPGPNPYECVDAAPLDTDPPYEVKVTAVTPQGETLEEFVSMTCPGPSCQVACWPGQTFIVELQNPTVDQPVEIRRFEGDIGNWNVLASIGLNSSTCIRAWCGDVIWIAGDDNPWADILCLSENYCCIYDNSFAGAPCKACSPSNCF